MKKIIFALLLLVSYSSFEQTQIYKAVELKDYLKLRGVSITNISADTSLSADINEFIPTQKAVRAYVNNHLSTSSSGGVNSVNNVSPLSGAVTVGTGNYLDNFDALVNGKTLNTFYRSGDRTKIVHSETELGAYARISWTYTGGAYNGNGAAVFGSFFSDGVGNEDSQVFGSSSAWTYDNAYGASTGFTSNSMSIEGRKADFPDTTRFLTKETSGVSQSFTFTPAYFPPGYVAYLQDSISGSTTYVSTLGLPTTVSFTGLGGTNQRWRLIVRREPHFDRTYAMDSLLIKGVLLNVFSSSSKGLVPASAGGSTTFLRADGVFASPPSGGPISVGTSGNTLYSSGFFSTGQGNTSSSSGGNNIFLGESAAMNASSVSNSIFLGTNAGRTTSASSSSSSVFIGTSSGQNATNSAFSNFIGSTAGYTSTNATFSNFIGKDAGRNAAFASNSNFVGANAGLNASNSSASNFFGVNAGTDATSAYNSNFIGHNAGYAASNASFCTLIGEQVGYNPGANNIGSNNIIIGKNISLPNATANSINLGAVLFGTGTHSDISSDPVIIPETNGKIGIGVVAPATTLDVNGAFTLRTTTTPSPASGQAVFWFDGTNVKLSKNVGGTTTTTTVF